MWGQRLHWVLDVDIRKYFDMIPHSHLRTLRIPTMPSTRSEREASTRSNRLRKNC